MCLTITSFSRVVETDIPVYKVLFGNMGPYQHFEYEPNKTYHQELEFSLDHRNVYAGFHSYRTRAGAEELIWYMQVCDETSRGYEARVVKFFIPKGSEYYCGDGGDIVSDSIRTDDMDLD